MSEGWNDQRIETLVGTLLRAGVLISAVVGLIGGAVYLLHHGHDAPRYHVFTGEPAEYRSVADIVADALQGRGRGLIQLGVLLLVATPVARVALCAFAFVKQRDRLYVGVTLFVLAVLLFSLLRVSGPNAL
jgi:uncharacterized membrane protein